MYICRSQLPFLAPLSVNQERSLYLYSSLWIWCKIEHQKSKLRKNPIPSLYVLREYVIYLNRVFSILNFVSSSMIFITLRKKYILSPFGIVHKWRHGQFCVCWIEKNAFFCLEVYHLTFQCYWSGSMQTIYSDPYIPQLIIKFCYNKQLRACQICLL